MKTKLLSFYMLYLIHGECPAQIEEEVESITNNNSETPFEKIRDKLTVQETILRCTTVDIFSPKKSWIIFEPKWIKKCSKDEINEIEKLLTIISKENLILIIICKSIDKRSALYKRLIKANCQEISCQPFKDWETDKMINWIKESALKKEIKLNINVIEQLLNAYGNNLEIIKKEIEKLSITVLPKSSIEPNDLVHSTSNSFGYYNQLSKSITNGNKSELIKSIAKLITLKEDPHKIFNQLLFNINNLIPISIGIELKNNHEAIAKKLNKHPFFIKKQMELINKNKIKNKFSELIILLAKLDQKIKKGDLSVLQALIKFSNHVKHQ